MKRILSVAFAAVCFLTGCSGESRKEREDTAADTAKGAETVKEREIDPNQPVIALTFDDGPNTSTTPAVLDKLQKHSVTASFFVVGNNINASTESVIKRAFDMGCEINNHSKTHSYMNGMKSGEIAEEIRYTSDRVEEITGMPTRFFRPPYIAVSAVMLEIIDMPFICGYGSDDWNPAVSTEDRASKILEQISDGGIILLHDMQGNEKTVDALDILIPALKERGYQFATVSRLFEAKGITPDGDSFVYSNALQQGAWG